MLERFEKDSMLACYIPAILGEVKSTVLTFLDTPTRQESLSRQAYAAVRRAIRDGIIVPGVFYSEPQIAKALEISRTPVREAVIELAREGVIEKVPQRGFRIRRIADNELAEVYDLRALIEGHVVRRLASVATRKDLEPLRRVIDKQACSLADPAEFLSLDEQFHLSMPTLLGHTHTHAMLLSLRSIMLVPGAVVLAYPERGPAVLAEHRAIIDRIAEHDGRAAVQAIRQHIEVTKGIARRSLQTGSAMRTDIPEHQ